VVEVIVSGVGVAEVAEATRRVLTDLRPSLVILAGIAGRYPSSGLKVGDVALVETEIVSDLGALYPKGFKPMYQKTYTCPYTTKFKPFFKAAGNTASTAAAPFVSFDKIDIENMEGAVFFAMCLGAGVPFLELRAVSNTVSFTRKDWNIPLAAENLAAGLNDLLKTIAKQFR
jgi:adenosylhomocysteine nucleosidase/futalosine hydrolase